MALVLIACVVCCFEDCTIFCIFLFIFAFVFVFVFVFLDGSDLDRMCCKIDMTMMGRISYIECQ